MEKKLIERTVGGLHAFLEQKIIKQPHESAVLDVATGTGAWIARLHNAGFINIRGIDKDVAQFDLDSSLVQRVDFDSEPIPFDNCSFDLITAIEIIEHIENPGFFLGEISRVLKPGGKIFLTTPNSNSLIARLRFFLNGKLKFFDEKADPTHIFPIFPDTFAKILSRHSLKIIKEFCFPSDGESHTSRAITKLLGKACRLFLKEKHPGDVLCFEIEKI